MVQTTALTQEHMQQLEQLKATADAKGLPWAQILAAFFAFINSIIGLLPGPTPPASK